jgi:polyphosphate glucokinase
MNILVVDVGGTSVKILATGHEEPRQSPSGPTLTAEQMVARVMEIASDLQYDVVTISRHLLHETSV